MTEHSAIERYIEALETKDFKALGDLFTSDGHYCDYCPNIISIYTNITYCRCYFI